MSSNIFRPAVGVALAATTFTLLAPLSVAAVSAAAAPAVSSPTFTGKVNIAAVQTDTKLGEKAHNLADMQARTREAATNGADLVVFPELSLTGYKYRTIAEMAPDAEPVPGPSTDAMAATAKETGTHIAFGMVEEDEGKFYDTVVLVGPEGYIGKYAKITMGHHSEAVLFTRGSKQPPVFNTSIGRIGLASCYDGAFPENARMMGLQGAQIMVLADAENGSTWREYIRTRAYENNAYAVVANRVGSERNSTFNGDSIVAGPDYQILADASTTDVETVHATVDLGKASNDFISQRRPELYRALTKAQQPAVLGVNAEPQSSLSGTATGSDVLVSTTAIKPGTAMTAELITASGAVVAKAASKVGFDQARLRLEVAADAPVGVHTLRVSAAGRSQEIPFTVKDIARPGALGTMPGADASLSSTAYIGFDSTLATDSDIPVTLSWEGGTRTLAGRVNTGNIDNRLTVPYTGLAAGTRYTLTVPADSVQDKETGVGNAAYSYQFTTVGTAVTSPTSVVQFDQADGEVTANLQAMLAQLETAAAAGTRLVTFGQFALTGDELSPAEFRAKAEPIDGPSVAALRAKAAELNLHVAFGMAEKEGAALYDTTVLLGPDGVVGTHRSTQLADHQVGIFTAGDVVAPVLDTPLGKVGLFSAQELLFPEVIRSLAVRGALTVIGGVDAEDSIWREVARSRGSENKVYVVVANQGTSGGSLITRTSRGIDAQLAIAEPGQAAFALNLITIANRWYTYVDASTAKARTTHYYLDRRPEIYAPLSARSLSKTTLRLDRSNVTLGGAGLTAEVTVTPGPDATANGTVELRTGSTLVASGPVRSGRAKVVVPSAKLTAGRVALTATYLGSDDLSVSASPRAVVQVNKASATIRVNRTKVKAGAKARLTVAVRVAGLKPTGKVAVRVAGVKRTATLLRGTATVRLPKLKPGKRTLKLSYAGSPTVEATNSRHTVRVRR